MALEHITIIADQMSLGKNQVKATADLLVEGATIPFISRYRKEATGSLDEVAVTGIRDKLKMLQELDARKTAVIKSMDQNGHLTDDLKQQVLNAKTLARVEDIYLPFRPKRRTRANKAREKGLEPLAVALFAQ